MLEFKVCEDFQSPLNDIKLWHVILNAEGEALALGDIVWFAESSEYTFHPEENIFFDAGILNDINAFLIEKNLEARPIDGQPN